MDPMFLEAPPGFEPGMEVLQTSALPLGYGAARTCRKVSEGRARRRGVAAEVATAARVRERKLERETGFEPATSTLARSHSTTELFPLASRSATSECTTRCSGRARLGHSAPGSWLQPRGLARP